MNTVAVSQTPTHGSTHALVASLADNSAEKTACLRLRYDTYAAERGARLVPNCPGLDSDYFDKYCQHLMVRNSADGALAAYARVLTDTSAYRAGLFYSQSAFEMGRVLNHRARFIEISRVCVRPEHRNPLTIEALLCGVGGLMQQHGSDYLMACVSIPLGEDGASAACALESLRRNHLATEDFRIFPKRPFQDSNLSQCEVIPQLPLAVRTLIQHGAKMCGEAYWDKRFNTADIVLMLTRAQVAEQFSTRKACA